MAYDSFPQGFVKIQGFGTFQYEDEWNGGMIEGTVVKINDRYFEFNIDPSDGYRSYGVCGECEPKELDVEFPDQIVWCYVKHIHHHDYWDGGEDPNNWDDILTIINPVDNSEILEVGTLTEDAWYPMGICHWSPENLPINKEQYFSDVAEA